MDKNISPDSKGNQLAALLNENMEKNDAKINKARVHKKAWTPGKIGLQIRAGIHLKRPVEH